MLDWQSFIAVGAVITLIIGAVVLVNWINFFWAANRLRLFRRQTGSTGYDDPLEQRAANIVQEMALAPICRAVTVCIDEETGINARVAGTSPARWR